MWHDSLYVFWLLSTHLSSDMLDRNGTYWTVGTRILNAFEKKHKKTPPKTKQKHHQTNVLNWLLCTQPWRVWNNILFPPCSSVPQLACISETWRVLFQRRGLPHWRQLQRRPGLQHLWMQRQQCCHVHYDVLCEVTVPSGLIKYYFGVCTVP